MGSVIFNGRMGELFFFLTLSLSSFVQTGNEQLNGFKEFTFGTTHEKYRNLVLELVDGDIELYTLNTDNLKIDGISFSYFRLTFNKRKLSVISIHTKNNGGSAFLKLLTKTYGEIKLAKSKKNSQWKNLKMTLIYESSKNGKEAIVSFYSDKF